ncbi:MAG: SDR family oxidoreductase [Methylococcaceae bacterium]|nr:MAG: SDR family oxidoreductase [Methylococcaceae bacterium]
MKTVLITGANRGLGLAFCRHYLAENWHVVACCRHPDSSAALLALAESCPHLRIEALEMTDFAQIDALGEKLSGVPIDLLINNAGIYPDTASNAFGQVDFEVWRQALLVNTFAPAKLTETMLASLHLGHDKLIVCLSSLMGSITDNTSGGSSYYRSSKAALNAVMKNLSLSLQNDGVGVLILHPGWVKTDMGGANALIDAEVSVRGMCQVIKAFTLTQSGQFINYDGKILPW